MPCPDPTEYYHGLGPASSWGAEVAELRSGHVKPDSVQLFRKFFCSETLKPRSFPWDIAWPCPVLRFPRSALPFTKASPGSSPIRHAPFSPDLIRPMVLCNALGLSWHCLGMSGLVIACSASYISHYCQQERRAAVFLVISRLICIRHPRVKQRAGPLKYFFPGNALHFFQNALDEKCFCRAQKQDIPWAGWGGEAHC